MMTDARLDFPSARRNAEPILTVLQQHLPAPAQVLEIASGSGQHAAMWTQSLERVHWWPSDMDPAHIASINAWRAASPARARIAPAQRIDVCTPAWKGGVAPVRGPAGFDAIINVNMIHIAPWAATTGLMAGAAKRLLSGAVMILYGPYRRSGRHTAASNAAFDAGLRKRNPLWGVRDMEEVFACAQQNGLNERAIIPMPANNFCLVLEHA